VTPRDSTPQPSELSTLERGTKQRGQLRVRLLDIAWTALFTVLALWAVWSAYGAVSGTGNWVYSAVAWVLLAIALTLRLTAVRRRTRL
jgi:hypothetical protein